LRIKRNRNEKLPRLEAAFHFMQRRNRALMPAAYEGAKDDA
jgi:hypothetical protein